MMTFEQIQSVLSNLAERQVQFQLFLERRDSRLDRVEQTLSDSQTARLEWENRFQSKLDQMEQTLSDSQTARLEWEARFTSKLAQLEETLQSLALSQVDIQAQHRQLQDTVQSLATSQDQLRQVLQDLLSSHARLQEDSVDHAEDIKVLKQSIVTVVSAMQEGRADFRELVSLVRDFVTATNKRLQRLENPEEDLES